MMARQALSIKNRLTATYSACEQGPYKKLHSNREWDGPEVQAMHRKLVDRFNNVVKSATQADLMWIDRFVDRCQNPCLKGKHHVECA